MNNKITYQSSKYNEKLVIRKYISYNWDNEIEVFECNKDNLTTKSYIMSENDYDKYSDKIEEAKSLRGFYPNQVKIM